MKQIFSLLLLMVCALANGQVQTFSFKDNTFPFTVNVGKGSATTTHPSAFLEIGPATGGTKGVLLARGDKNQIVNPAVGLIIFDIPTLKYWTYTGAQWEQLGGGAVAWGNVSGKPTTLAGYGITDPVLLSSASYSNPTWLTGLAWSKITGAPTTLAGYGITDPVLLSSASYSNPTWLTGLAWSKITGAPTTFTPASGSSFYIQAQNTAAQNVPFWISGTAKIDNTLTMGGAIRFDHYAGNTGYPRGSTAGMVYYDNSVDENFMGNVKGIWKKFVMLGVGEVVPWVTINPTSTQGGNIDINGTFTAGGATTLNGGLTTAGITTRSGSSAAIDRGGEINFQGYISGSTTTRLFAKVGGYKENATNLDRLGYLAFFTDNANGDLVEHARITSAGIFNFKRAIALANLTSAPASPINGWKYYNSTTNEENTFVGGAWKNTLFEGEAPTISTYVPTSSTDANGNVGDFTVSNGFAYFKKASTTWVRWAIETTF